MGATSYDAEREALERSFERHREELGQALEQIPHSTRRALSPGKLVARHPWPWLAAGAALGLAVALRASDVLDDWDD